MLVLSPAILTEVKRVLTYPHVQARWPLTEAAIDTDDDPILQTAVEGRAGVLCSRDNAFDHEAVERVCAAHSIGILDDITLIHELRRLRAV